MCPCIAFFSYSFPLKQFEKIRMKWYIVFGVKKMASRYTFSEEEIREIEQARKEKKGKRAEARLKALELRAQGATAREVSGATGFHEGSITRLVAKFRDRGIEAISGNHDGGHHRNRCIEEEAAILAPFKAQAEKGELVEISEIANAYQNRVDHPIGKGQVYNVLHRHGWRKVMPRSRHPQKASEEKVAASKKEDYRRNAKSYPQAT